MTVELIGKTLDFAHLKLPYRYIAHYKMVNGIKEN